MVSADYNSQTKDQIRDGIIAEVQGYFDSFDTLEATNGTYESDKYDVKVKHITAYDQICTITKGKFPGLTVDKHKEFRKNLTEIATKMAPKMTISDLPAIDGNAARFIEIPMPMFISTRNIINVYYEKDDGDASWFITSSRGTGAQEEELKDKIGSNVIATNHFQADKLIPYDGGVEIWGASVMNINGSVPEFLKKKGATRGQRRVEGLAHFLITGERLFQPE